MSKKLATDAQLRKLDREIVELLNRRAEAALGRAGDGVSAMVDPAVVQQAVESSGGPLPPSAIGAVFRELLSGIRAASRPLRAAYLGPEYTYSHLAAIAQFGQSAELVPVASIRSVFEEVERGHADYGVVPIENSTDGRVADSLECLANSRLGQSPTGSGSKRGEIDRGAGGTSSQPTLGPPVQICAEVPLRIRHCLLGRGRRSEIRRVCSKPQALSQCRHWLAAHLPNATLEPTASTAEAAALAAANSDAAAIGAEQAAANHGLDVLARNIEDNSDNVTRFAVIGRNAAEPTGRDKTSLVFEAPHQPGALADAMAIFKRQQLNLTWIESFPIPQARGRYLFFVEFQGHATDANVQRAITALQKKSLRLVLLGSYAEAAVVG